MTSDGPGTIRLTASFLERRLESGVITFHRSSSSQTGVCVRITWKDCWATYLWVPLRVPDWENLGGGLRICISTRFSGDTAAAAAVGTHSENHCMTAFCCKHVGREAWGLGAGTLWRGRGQWAVKWCKHIPSCYSKVTPLSLYSFSDVLLIPKNVNNTLCFC